MDFETEEQQIEAIKKWWKENSNMIIGGIAVGVSAIFGWQYYQGQSIVHTENASVLYEQVIVNLENPAVVNEQMARVNELQAEYSDTPYAGLGSLLLSKQQMASGEFVKAQQQLEWLASNAQQDEVKYLAKIRLARLLSNQQQIDKAMAILNESFPDSFKAMVYELKGDVLILKGDMSQAKSAYQQALSTSASPGRWLQQKIDDISLPENKITTEKLEPSA